MKHILVIFVSLLVMVGCKKPTILVDENPLSEISYFEEKYPSSLQIESLKDLSLLKNATHFFVIGDWGRQGYFNQAELGATMNQISMVIEPDFIISTGDNFYDSGVASVNDPLWKYSFEEIYNGNFLQVPWYVTLGNHDYRGNTQAQIDYSNISRRWTLPAPYWDTSIPLDESKTAIEFTFIDTTPFQDDYYKKSKYEKAVSETDSSAQKIWLNKRLSNIKPSSWNIVVGHHPMYTGGKRHNAISYTKKHLEKLFDEHKVDVYFCGHEHDLQHIKPKNHDTHHFISGAGSEVRPTEMTSESLAAVSETGIMVISVTPEKILVQFVNYKGEIKYKTKLYK